MTLPASSPVSLRLRVAGLPAAGAPVTIVANEEQRAALAREHELLSVESFRAELVAKPFRREGVRVSGRVGATITQRCVVTLEPLESRIDEEVSALFVPEGSSLSHGGEAGGELVLEPEGPDAPEPFSGDSLDVGVLAEEFFELGIDPYPRKPGAEIETNQSEDAHAQTAGPMYESLKKLRSGG